MRNAALAALFCAFALRAQSVVTLVPVATPATAQPLVTSVTVTGSGFPAGAITPANVTVTLTANAQGGGSGTTQATAVQPIVGTTERVTFQVPGSIAPTVPAPYQISIAGVTATGASFSSGNTASLTINPAARIVSLSPSFGNAALTVLVTITADYSNFLPGVTQASFGAGISVGGGSYGQPGPVIVNSATSATAELSIFTGATAGTRPVTVATGTQSATIPHAFTVGPPAAIIDMDSTITTSIPAGFSGFNDGHLVTAVEYYDPKFVKAVQALKPGWIRFPGGTPSMAYDWQSGHESQTWIDTLTPEIDSFTVAALLTAQELTQSAGGVYFSDFVNFIKAVGVPGIVCFNGYSDTHPGSAGSLASLAQSLGANILEWELSNEPYFYPLVFAGPSAYASAMYNPYYQDIVSANPNANVGLFFEGKYDFYTSNFMAWDDGMSTYAPAYWKSVSTHVYPIIQTDITSTEEEYVLNGVLAHGTGEYINSYLVPLVGADTPIYITEINSSVDKAGQTPSGTPPIYTGAVAFESYLFNGIFLAEYVARMSTVPNVKAVGVTSLYLGNEFNYGMLRAANDHQGYLIAQLEKNPNFSTDTATNPYTQFQFYVSAPGLAVAVVNQAINNSTNIWPTTVTGGPNVPIEGFDNKPVPAIFAQAYIGDNGTHYLVITNKSNAAVPIGIEIDGSLLTGNVNLAYVSNSNPLAENTGDQQTYVKILNTTATNPITVGPYSVTRVEW
jgi:hypothetical protein